MIEYALALVLAVSVFLMVHTYVLYPILLYFWASGSDEAESERRELPSVALVIAAYNEESAIAEKIENSLSLDYPSELLTIIVFSDASSDRTDEIVRSYANSGVELVRIEGRVGKTECQNRVTSKRTDDIIVYSDANSMYEPDAIRQLVNGFSPGVGCVVVELRYRDDSDVEGESTYWKYETFIKRLESKVNSLVGGNGSIYAVRNSSYVPLDEGAISDFAEPLAIVANGEDVKYAPAAVAWENTGQSVETEFDRRNRIVTRSWHTLASFSHLLNPVKFPVFSFQLASHKLIRWISPLLLGAAFASNVGLLLVSPNVLYTLLFVAQLGFYSLAALGALGDRVGIATRSVFHIPYYFVVANYGMLLGFYNFISRENIVTWNTAARKPD